MKRNKYLNSVLLCLVFGAQMHIRMIICFIPQKIGFAGLSLIQHLKDFSKYYMSPKIE